MGLSRLDNFLKSGRGTILYVDPSSLDSTDSIENKGNSLTRPFKTIQRALIEAARFSYQRGSDNDRFNKTTIVLYPGDHVVDNRPGWIPSSAGDFKLRSGASSSNFSQWDLATNLDLTFNDNALYKLNSIHGGVIVPRGTSIVGMDLRKTKIRPLYVPSPTNDQIERSAVFRVTGGCYFWQFTVLDSDPNGVCYKDYTTNTFVPNFSHHKLSCFEYADGTNNVAIKDDFWPGGLYYDRTDLDMYYEKVGLVYGSSSNREILNDFPSTDLDIEPVVDEYRIVGSRGSEVGITSIRSGDGVTGSTTITVTLEEEFGGLSVDTPIQISGIDKPGYDGQYVVSALLSPTQIQYRVQNIPSDPLPGTVGSILNIAVDTVTSASPYIFNCSLRSVYGMCGMLADGSKASGFKSMVVAQFTGIGLQKDDNAFIKYDSSVGEYRDALTYPNLHSDSRARFKQEYENFHIKADNNAFIQVVSVFAIGYAEHFVSSNGGDLSVTNSNSNFGAKSLVAKGFRNEAFQRDDIGYITHIVTPREIDINETSIEFSAIDVATTVSAASTNRLYLYNETNRSVPPSNVIDGYRVGAKYDDRLYVGISQSGITTEYSARIIMPNTQYSGAEKSSEKLFVVAKNNLGINSIGPIGGGVGDNVIALTQEHSFINGESVRIISENGHLPDGLEDNQIYYAITSGSGITTVTQIKVAKTLNDAIQGNAVSLNYKGGTLNIISRVSDKNSGDIGHPIQYDSTNSQWYVNVATAATERTLYNTIVGLGTTSLGSATSRTHIKRNIDSRSLSDSIYKVRYVIPKDSPITARPPLDGYVIQESNTTGGLNSTEVAKYSNPSGATLSYTTDLRNFRFISNAEWVNGITQTANIYTELPHNLNIGSVVEVTNVVSTGNTVGTANTGFNGTFEVTGISSAKHFSYSLTLDPGTFTVDTSARTVSLPRFKRKTLPGTYQIYRTQEIQPYVPNVQDGIYHLVLTNASNSPTVTEYSSLKFGQPLENLYPQVNRDNPSSDPDASQCFALPEPIGQVIINDPQKSITKETIQNSILDFGVGIAVTNVVSSSTTSHTLYTTVDHGLAGITSVGIVTGGSGYVTGTYYNARLVGFAGSTTGSHATARVTVGAGGTITSVSILDRGSAYGIGNTLSLVGVGTSGSGAYVSVTDVNDPTNTIISITGVTSSAYSPYNTLYRVKDVTVGKPKEINVFSSRSISGYSTTGLGITDVQRAVTVLCGKVNSVSSIDYNISSGIATISFASNHGLRTNQKIRLEGATDSFFNNDFVVTSVGAASTTITVNAGIATATPSTTGDILAYTFVLSSNAGDINLDDDYLSPRLIAPYAGLTTSLNVSIAATASSSTDLNIANASTLDLEIGDYLQIDNEIFRVKSTVTSDSVPIFRGLFGTDRENHTSGAVVRKIKPIPIEFRRNSIIRASGHTFEYLGFGPGNYSTALPERQDRILSKQEEFLSQSTKLDGGISIFTAMNSSGDFYTGNKKINSATGQEEVFDSPIPSVVGEEIQGRSTAVGFDILSPLEVSVSRSLRVEGGSDRTIVSQFDGPVVFNNKITSNSTKGIEASSLFVQGDATISRKYTVGISTPSNSGTSGDVVYKAEPTSGGYLGWVYTTDNKWKQFGAISTSTNSLNPIFDICRANQFIGTFFGDGSGLTNVDSIWATDAIGVHTTRSIGVGTTSAVSNTALYVNGNTTINGTLKVFEVIEKATISAGILTAQNPVGVATTTNIDLAENNVYYFTNQAEGNWGLNFRGNSTTTLDSFLATGDSMTVAILTTQGSTAYYNSSVKIDGITVTPKYYGGTTITSGNVDSIDLYTYVIIKTGAAAFTVLYSQSQYA